MNCVNELDHLLATALTLALSQRERGLASSVLFWPFPSISCNLITDFTCNLITDFHRRGECHEPETHDHCCHRGGVPGYGVCGLGRYGRPIVRQGRGAFEGGRTPERAGRVCQRRAGRPRQSGICATLRDTASCASASQKPRRGARSGPMGKRRPGTPLLLCQRETLLRGPVAGPASPQEAQQRVVGRHAGRDAIGAGDE